MGVFKPTSLSESVNWINYFRKWATKYEKDVEGYGYDPEKLIKPFLKLIGMRKTALDVGCGTGKGLEVISKFCENLSGIEPVEKMAIQSKQKGFQILQMKARNIGKLKMKFDFISFFASIDYVSIKQVVKGCKQILNEGGLIFLTMEPKSEKRILDSFLKNDFFIIKKEIIHAYRGQEYVCVLIK